ncbi:hypothetical protein SAMN02745166_00697 [Prosthecobacter debontii]|uniref:Uncharacterized protein n=2 Tax=Prosthecobacter debontii TaxID=48467 RepID=A0A1T4WU78_9BACT|nr:hypothetical protein SAMN02745166_00697 [Prosthecobacter debontii]
MSGLAIAGIGCLGLIVLIFLAGGALVAKFMPQIREAAAEFEKDPAKAATMLALKMNPDVEVLNTDDTKREVTFKLKSSGETTTISYEDFEKGKMKIKNSKGEEYTVDASKAETEGMVIKGPDGQIITGGNAAATAPPAWVPLYPGLALQEGGARMQRPDGGVSGLAVGKVAAPSAQVYQHYETDLKSQGYEVTSSFSDEHKAGNIQATKDDGKTILGLTISTESDGQTQVALTYQEAAK